MFIIITFYFFLFNQHNSKTERDKAMKFVGMYIIIHNHMCNAIGNIKFTTIHVCKKQQIASDTFLISNIPMVACIEMKLGMYAYYIISKTITCFHDNHVLFEKASGNFLYNYFFTPQTC